MSARDDDPFDVEGLEAPSSPPGTRSRRVGPIVLLVPVLLFLLAVLILKERVPDRGPRPTPPAAAEGGEVPGWSGALESRAVRLTASITRLHAAPERQAFDARALRRRLGLAEGEPWLLTLRYPPAGTSATGDAAALDLERRTEPPPELAVASLFVADEAGRALAPLDAPAVSDDGVADPLRTLLAPSAVRVVPGRTAYVFLWGREPGAGAELRGLPSPLVAGADEAVIALQPKAVQHRDDALAMLDRGPAPEPRTVEAVPSLVPEPGTGTGEEGRR